MYGGGGWGRRGEKRCIDGWGGEGWSRQVSLSDMLQPADCCRVSDIGSASYQTYLADLLLYSIIAVTGLDGHADESWRGEGNPGRI